MWQAGYGTAWRARQQHHVWPCRYSSSCVAQYAVVCLFDKPLLVMVIEEWSLPAQLLLRHWALLIQEHNSNCMLVIVR
jgi:hypothetical protein